MNKKLERKLNTTKELFKEGIDMTVEDKGTYVSACLLAGLALVQTKSVPKALIAGGSVVSYLLLSSGVGMIVLGALFGELSEDEED